MLAECRLVYLETWHIDYVAARMRESDKNEIMSSSGRDAYTSLVSSVSSSDESRTVLAGDTPIAICGLSVRDNFACPWLLGTDLIAENQLSFLRLSDKWIKEKRKQFDILVNFVDERNETSKKWLDWLGFKINDPIPYGVNNEPFHLFEMRSERV